MDDDLKIEQLDIEFDKLRKNIERACGQYKKISAFVKRQSRILGK